MRNAVIALWTLAIVAAVPSSAHAWGTAAHRFIMRRAIDMLPPELKPFFDRFREEIVVRTIDPDTWRNVGYDGQLTGQNGVHARFERDLFERFESRLRVNPAPPLAIANARDTAFDILLVSYRLVDPILKADKDATAGKETYDADYYETFFTAVRPILERQLAASITATAGVIMGAWEQAGRPVVRMEDARPVQKVRPARSE